MKRVWAPLVLVGVLCIAGCQSPLAPKVTAPPNQPTAIAAAAGDGQVTVTWAPVDGASGYDLYYSTTSGVTFANATKLAGVTSPKTLSGLTNGTTYYFVVKAVSAGGASAPSDQASATPQVPPTGAPSGVAAASGDNQVTVTWNAVAGATGYNLFYSSTPGFETAKATKLTGTTSPTTVSGLTNGTTYYFVVTAVNPGGESVASAPTSAAPQVPVGGTPTGVAATSGDTLATVTWNAVPDAISYNLYYSTTPGFATDGATKLVGVTSPRSIGSLKNGTKYYFVVTAVNAGGESPPSAPASAVPQVNRPTPPLGVTATSGDTQVTVSWNPVVGAASYNVYYSATPGVTTATGVQVTNATSPMMITGLTDGTAYYFIVTAVNVGGETASAQVSQTPQVLAPPSPSGVGASPGDGQAVVTWGTVSGATSYNLYYSTSAAVTKGTGTKLTGVTSPRTVTGLTDGTTYYFVITAVNDGGESSASSPASATPRLPAPALMSASSGVGSATISYYSVSGATGYNLYYSTNPGVTTATGSKISGLSSIYEYAVNGLTNGTTYYFIATSKNSSGESAAGPTIAVTPQPALTWTKKTTAAVYRTWMASASSSDGTKLVACLSSGDIYTSSDAGVTWTDRTTAGSRSWRAVASSDDGLKLAACVSSGDVFTSTDGGATWTDRTGAGTASWTSIASSSDGSHLALVGSSGTGVLTSSDGGVTWTDRSSVTGNQTWCAIASSSDGLRLTATISNGQVLTSSDGGASWTTRSPDGYSKQWHKVSSSGDGSRIAATEALGLWISLDAGATWKRAAGSNWDNAVYSADGTKLYAYPFGGAVSVSSDNGVTWTALPNSGTTQVRSSLNVSADGTKLFSPTTNGMDDLYTSSDSGVTWIDRTPGFRGWEAVTMSSDGTKLAACGNTTDIFTSSDGGTTWIDRNSGSRQWSSLAGSSDGTRLVAAAASGFICTSSDSGATWTAQTSAGSRNWGPAASSADGTMLAVCNVFGAIYTSTDGGQTWLARSVPSGLCWRSIASSSDGMRLVAVVGNGTSSTGDVYTSSDGGATWTDRTAAGTRVWQSVCSSADGMRLAAGAYGGLVSTSDDGGITWTAQASTGSLGLSRLSSSADGKKLVATASNYLYTSIDGGLSWMKQTASGPKYWGGTFMGSDGSRVFAGEFSFGDLWIGQ